MLKLRIMIVVLTLLATTALIASNMRAHAKSEDECRPGWGHNDPNHCHTGPPGLSVRP